MADPHQSRQWDIRPKHVVVSLLTLILVIFALLNIHEVRVDFIFRDARTPLIFVITGSAVVGFVIGWFVRARADRNN